MSKGRRYEDEEPKLNVKKVLVVVIVIAVIIMMIYSFKNLLSKDTSKIISKKEYFVAYENNKWGVIDNSGNIVINPLYEEMIIIPDKTKPIFICTYDVNYENGTFKTKVINEEEKILYTDYENVQVLDNYDNLGNIWYEQNVLKVKKNGKYGLINLEGKEILECNYDNIETLKNIENSLILTKEGKYGIGDNVGSVIIEPEYKEVKALGKKYSDGYIVIDEANKYGAISNTKKVLLETKYEEIKPLTGADMYVIEEEGKWQILKKSGEKAFDYDFDDVKEINLNNIIVKKDEKFGAISLTGEQIIPNEYDDLTYAFNDKYIAKKETKYGIIDSTNKEIIGFEYTSLDYRKEEDFIEGAKDEINSIIIDKELNVRITGIISEVNVEKGYIRARVGDEYKYYNFKFEEKKAKDVLLDNNLFLSKRDGKYGFVDSNDNTVVDFIYDDATEQNSCGYAAIKKDGKWGSINKKGEVVLEPNQNLDNNLVINFIGKWHLAEEININYYIQN